VVPGGCNRLGKGYFEVVPFLRWAAGFLAGNSINIVSVLIGNETDSIETCGMGLVLFLI